MDFSKKKRAFLEGPQSFRINLGPLRVTMGLILLLALTVAPLTRTIRAGAGAPSGLRKTPPAAVSVARLHYTGGGDWYWGSSAIPNLLKFTRDNTLWPVDTIEGTVSVSEDELYDHPFLFATGHGVIRFDESARDQLRTYLKAGGFLFINDSYGMASSAIDELKRLFPDRELVELPFSHPLYHSYFDFPNGPPKIHEHDNKPPVGLGLLIDNRVAVYLLLESDIGDGWEDSQVHNDPPEKRLAALKMGVNLLAYALTN